MLLAILTAWLAYKKAKDTGRNGILWALIGAAVFIGTQITVAFGIGIILGLGIAFAGWPETVFENYDILIRIIAVVFSLGTSWLLLRYLDKVPEQPSSFSGPPSPPKFD